MGLSINNVNNRMNTLHWLWDGLQSQWNIVELMKHKQSWAAAEKWSSFLCTEILWMLFYCSADNSVIIILGLEALPKM